MKLRILTLLLALAMLLSVTACTNAGGDTDTETASGTTAGTENGTETPTETPTEAPTAADTTAGDATEAPTAAPESATQAEPAGDAPVITLSSTTDLSAKAGETIDLPEVKVTDTNGRDITSWLEVSDNAEPDSVSGGKFCATVAGKHTLYYFVENADGKIGEAFLTVNVEGAIPNTFDVQGMDDCENMKEYKTFRDGFESGRKSPLYADIGDSGKATHLSAAANEAIEGNSLVIDFVKSAGASATAIYFNGFNDCFHRGKQATYRVTFSYKLLEANNNTGDIYIGLSWDGSNGINRQFIPAGAEVGKVYTYTAEFPSAIVPEGGNAYFFIFKLNKANDPIVVAFDNFIIETEELKQVTSVIPTAEELAKGFTWDFTKNGAICGDGQTVAVSSLPEEIKSALSGRDGFGENVLKLTRAADHNFAGLTENNLTPGKKLVIDMEYYAVNDKGFYLIMMGRAGNPTQTVENTADGAFHTVHLETRIQNGWYQLNIYGQNNPSYEIYIGRITVRVVDEEESGNKTVNGHEFGMTFEQNSRAFGMIDNDKLTMSAYDGYDFGEYAAKMGENPTKFTFKNASDVLVEWFRTEGKMETGYRYEMTVTYYVADAAGDGLMMYCMDRGAFPHFADTDDYMTPGFHQVTTEWTADRDVDFFCFYLDQNGLNGSLYVKGVTVKLLGK